MFVVALPSSSGLATRREVVTCATKPRKRAVWGIVCLQG